MVKESMEENGESVIHAEDALVGTNGGPLSQLFPCQNKANSLVFISVADTT